jgi:hypothetical protein
VARFGPGTGRAAGPHRGRPALRSLRRGVHLCRRHAADGPGPGHEQLLGLLRRRGPRHQGLGGPGRRAGPAADLQGPRREHAEQIWKPAKGSEYKQPYQIEHDLAVRRHSSDDKPYNETGVQRQGRHGRHSRADGRRVGPGDHLGPGPGLQLELAPGLDKLTMTRRPRCSRRPGPVSDRHAGHTRRCSEVSKEEETTMKTFACLLGFAMIGWLALAFTAVAPAAASDAGAP